MFCVVIPAYQAADTLPLLVKTISQEFQQNDIFIVDDGSTDETPDILGHYPQIHLIKHAVNKGKGAALLSGFHMARQLGHQYAICLDADLQHDPHYIRRFVEAQRNNQVDLVLGVRRFDWRTMPLHRILSNTITSFLISLRTGKRVHDSQCGYRLINLNIIENMQFSENGFQFESEILIKLLSAGYNYSEVEIPTIYNKARSSISNVRDTLKFIHLLLKSYLWL